MKTTVLFLLYVASTSVAFAQQAGPEGASRVPFVLKNTLGYHRMFRAEGPGIAYGFTMNRNEATPVNWPVGTRLYFSRDGETTGGLILTVTAEDAGKTLRTDVPDHHRYEDSRRNNKPARQEGVTILLRNNSLLPRRVALISYQPTETGNGTTIFTLMPLGVRRVKHPVGTRLYIASSEQVDVVMSGRRIDSQKPFLTVRREDAFQTFNIFD